MQVSTRQDGLLLDAEETARLLNVKKSMVYNLAKTGRLPAHRVGRYLRFSPQEVLNATLRGPEGGGGDGQR